MTFEEWWSDYLAQGGKTHFNILANRESAEAAHKAGQESIRPLVEKMREALELIELATRYIEGDKALHVLATKAIAEVDKFLGDGK